MASEERNQDDRPQGQFLACGEKCVEVEFSHEVRYTKQGEAVRISGRRSHYCNPLLSQRETQEPGETRPRVDGKMLERRIEWI